MTTYVENMEDTLGPSVTIIHVAKVIALQEMEEQTDADATSSVEEAIIARLPLTRAINNKAVAATATIIISNNNNPV